MFATYLTGSPELLAYSPRGVKALVVYLLVALEKKEIHICSVLIIIGQTQTWFYTYYFKKALVFFCFNNVHEFSSCKCFCLESKYSTKVKGPCINKVISLNPHKNKQKNPNQQKQPSNKTKPTKNPKPINKIKP